MSDHADGRDDRTPQPLSRRTFIRTSGSLAVASALGACAAPAEQTTGEPAPAAAQPVQLNARAVAFMQTFGLRYPIVQAAPGGERLAAAVANAGGFGALGAGFMGPDDAYAAVSRLVAGTPGNFYGNFVLHHEPASLGRTLEAGCRTIQFSWGLPSSDAVSRVREAGARMGIQVTSRQNAERALELQPDFLICQGLEAGGHVQATSFLDQALPAVLEVSADVPVLVAGGITTGHDIREVVDRGAAGAVLGTRFIATEESEIHERYKRRLVDAGEHATVYTHCFNQDWDAMHRVLRNRTFLNWEAAGCPRAGSKPGEDDIVADHPVLGGVVRYNTMPPLADHTGEVEDMAMYAGAGVAGVQDVPSAADLIARLWQEFEGA